MVAVACLGPCTVGSSGTATVLPVLPCARHSSAGWGAPCQIFMLIGWETPVCLHLLCMIRLNLQFLLNAQRRACSESGLLAPRLRSRVRAGLSVELCDDVVHKHLPSRMFQYTALANHTTAAPVCRGTEGCCFSGQGPTVQSSRSNLASRQRHLPRTWPRGGASPLQQTSQTTLCLLCAASSHSTCR